ncbi:multicopper oxidase domain-containing protein [Alicyclobacillus herbarius]|uniref:multicopper oxidase domain-containing protein n=1 Tax=Alicyclobacillus herbarius TaxID=122960 RepID=UPI000419B9A7|nr:multicopper oxidase domain-containing protein [Alicyclobacillus herbarius]
MKQHLYPALVVLTALGLAITTAGCQTTAATDHPTSASTSSVTTDKKQVTVKMSQLAYSPQTLHVTVGTTVTWRNDDTMAHTVTSGQQPHKDGRFDSGNLDPGQTFSYTFKKPGRYPYFCTYHPGMTGTVVVSQAVSDSQVETSTNSGNQMAGNMDHSSAASDTPDHVAALGSGTQGEPKQPDDTYLLPYKMEHGYKVFHLTAEPVWWQVKPGEKVEAWAYNGSVPGPEIKVDQGDKVKIVVDNKLPEGTTVHWHGLDVPFSQDGTGGISQPDIKPGHTWTYSFTVKAPPGTYMYHSHPMKDMEKQEDMGLFGPFIVEPKGTGWKQVHPGYQREYTLVVNDSPQFGYTINGLSYPATPVLPAKVGDKVLVHLINIGSMDHPMHLHGMHFQWIEQDGRSLPQPMTIDTLNTAPGTTYDLSFVASQVGKWLFHCHITAHTTDSQGNMSGMITMFDVTK